MSSIQRIRFGVLWPVNSKTMGVQLYNSPTMQRRKLQPRERFLARNPRGGSPVSASRGWQTVFLDVYRNFLQDCEDKRDLPFRPRVYAAGYNFTRSNRRSALDYVAVVTKRALKETLASAVIFVTHSMGCLPVRSLLLMAPEIRKLCAGVIHVAAPNDGSPEILARYFRGVLSDKRAIRALFGDAGWKAATSASAIPATFELLPVINSIEQRNAILPSTGPAPGFPSDDPLFLKALTRFQFTNPASVQQNQSSPRFRTARGLLEDILGDIDTFVRDASQFRTWLGNYFFERTASIVLTGLPTVQSVRFAFTSPEVPSSVILNVTSDGDGTVPVFSQRSSLRPEQLKEVSGIEHSEALKEKTDVYKHAYDFMSKFATEYYALRFGEA